MKRTSARVRVMIISVISRPLVPSFLNSSRIKLMTTEHAPDRLKTRPSGSRPAQRASC